jgi:hypothetical protein
MGQFISAAVLTFLGSRLGGLIPAFGVLGKLCLAVAAVALVARFTWGRKTAA